MTKYFFHFFINVSSISDAEWLSVLSVERFLRSKKANRLIEYLCYQWEIKDYIELLLFYYCAWFTIKINIFCFW